MAYTFFSIMARCDVAWFGDACETNIKLYWKNVISCLNFNS